MIALGAALRIAELGRLPGVNGDEAWYGVQMQRLAAGETLDWRTPTGNLMGPVQAGLLLLLQAVFPAGFALLRWPAVLSGLAAIALSGAVIGRRFGSLAGWSAAALAATLPAALAYSRFGWDPSHTGPPALLALAAALAGSVAGVALLFPLLLWIHPTNVFLAPFLAGAFVGAERERRGRSAAALRGAALAAGLAAGTLVLRVTTSGRSPAPPAADVLGRALSPAEWKSFALHLVRFLTGDATHAYVAGPPVGPALTAVDVAGGLAVVGLAVGSALLARRDGLTAATGAAGGLGASLLVFAAIVGARGLAPHTERYALWMLTPLVTVAAVVAAAVPAGRRRLAGALLALSCAGLLLHTWQGYFRELERTGSRSHPTFWTGPREPKEVAVERVLEVSGGRRPLLVVADGWWTLWPLRYLLHGRPGVVVVPVEEVTRAPRAGAAFLVGFPDAELPPVLARAARAVPLLDVPGTGRPVALRVWRLEPTVEP